MFPSFSQKYHHGKISILSSRRVFMPNIFHYNILVTLDRNYLKVLSVMLYSLSQSDPDAVFTVYVANNSLTEDDFSSLRTLIPRTEFVDVRVCDELLSGAPISDRYPKEMYFRLFAAQYLPQELDRILYLDPDLVILNDLRGLYSIDFQNHLFAASSHIESTFFKNFNRHRLHLSKEARYIKSGVMMLNLSLLRKEQHPQEIYDFINEHKTSLLLPDQDILNALYADRTIFLDPLIYNLGEKYLRLKNLHLPKEEKLGIDWIRNHTAVVHYYGRNKPWKEGYHGKLGIFYQEFLRDMESFS